MKTATYFVAALCATIFVLAILVPRECDGPVVKLGNMLMAGCPE